MTYTLSMIVYLINITIMRMKLNIVGNIYMSIAKIIMHFSIGYFIVILISHREIQAGIGNVNNVFTKPKLVIQHEYG